MDSKKTEKLPDILIESLYRTTLITEEASAKPLSNKKTDLEKKSILVVAHSPEPELAEKQSVFLQSILGACKIGSDAVNIITNSDPFFGDYKNLSTTFGPGIILLFGVDPAGVGLPMHFPPFQIQSFQKAQYLWAPDLGSIEMDNTHKRALWNSLQKLFSKHE